MKKVLIATHIDFWRQGAGHRARILALVKYLSTRSKLTVLYAGVEMADDATMIRELGSALEIVYLDRKNILTPEEYGRLLREFLTNNRFDACIVEYVELSFILNYIPFKMKLLLDTHDIHSDRNKSFENFGLKPVEEGYIFSAEEEYNMFRLYDAVMLINYVDYEKVRKVLGPDRLILAPHPPEVVVQAVRNPATVVGFVGSAYEPNVHAITFVLKEVWPSFQDSGLTLAVYGEVGKKISQYTSATVKAMGFVPDLKQVYSQIDVVINPVMFGAGLKIKNMEALANGLPLITTSHGANGISGGAGEAFVIADTGREFIDALYSLIHDHHKRQLLARNAIAFIENNFSPEQCFRDVIGFIEKD